VRRRKRAALLGPFLLALSGCPNDRPFYVSGHENPRGSGALRHGTFLRGGATDTSQCEYLLPSCLLLPPPVVVFSESTFILPSLSSMSESRSRSLVAAMQRSKLRFRKQTSRSVYSTQTSARERAPSPGPVVSLNLHCRLHNRSSLHGGNRPRIPGRGE